MKKRLLILLGILVLGIGIFSDVIGKANDSASRQAGLLATEMKTEIEIPVNGPVDIVWDESGLVDAPEPEPEPEVVSEPVVEAKPQVMTKPEPKSEPEPDPEPVATQAAAPVYREPASNIKITGRTLEIVDVDNTTVDAGDHVNRYGQKFLYGHNSDAVFGALKNVGGGAKFTVTIDGGAKTYRVAKVVIFEKNSETGRLELDGERRYNGKDYMNELAKGRFQGAQYDLSIMTCYGTPYANRDASHRYVIFANEV